jgi:hypothetical protein
MNEFYYVVWLTDPGNEDYPEWPACFRVLAETANDAQAWGDHLARDYCQRRGPTFLSSELVEWDESWDRQPVVKDGTMAGDDEIGW